MNELVFEKNFRKESIDIYLCFIDHLKAKLYDEKTIYKKHRILPQHAGGTYKMNGNVVLCTFEDHRLAHYYRFLAYRQKSDLIAWKFMKGLDKEARIEMASFAGKLGGKKSSNQNKANNSFFFNKEWQKMHGDKGGGKRNVESGWLSSLNQQISCSKG